MYLGSTFNITAQTHQCGHELLYNDLFQDTFFMQYLLELEEEHHQMVLQHRNNGSPAINVTIPVVVHVLHLPGESIGQGNNIDPDDVNDAIDDLNDRFDGTGIEFCLALRDQQGNILIEPGIVRVPVSANDAPSYAYSGLFMGGATEIQLKQLGPDFSNHNYMNIWVVNTISSANPNFQVLGFAYQPNTSASYLDGITIINKNHPTYPCFGVSGNTVLVHEVGHYLKLYHTFTGDDANYDGYPDRCPSVTEPFPLSDGIDDTQAHMRSGSNSCPSGSHICDSGDLADISNNYMDYSRFDCQTEFTLEQLEAMGCAIMTFRPSLLNSMGCVAGCANPFVVDFTYVPDVPVAPDGNGQNAQPGIFTATSSGNSYNWYINGAFVYEGSTLTHTFQKAGIYNVCLRETNSSNCTIETCKEVLVYDQGLCYNPTLPNCEILLNGDFSQIDETKLYNFTPQFPLQPNSNFEFGPFGLDFSNVLCNWVPYYRRNESNPIITPAWYRYDDGVSFISLWAEEDHVEGFGTQFELPLVNEVTYELTFDYRTHRKIDKFFFTLTQEKGIIDLNANKIYESVSFNSSPPFLPFPFEKSVDFIKEKVVFTYEGNSGKYLYFAAVSDATNFVSFLDITNISIKECNFCEADPDFTYTEDECGTFTFTGVNNGGGPDIMYWTVQGGPNIVNQSSFTYKFPFHGTYTVCLNITCENGITSQICKNVTTSGTFPDPNNNVPIACELCQDPQTTYVSALRCDRFSDVFEVENFTVQIPKGYKPCTHTLYIEGHNGSVNTNSYVFDRTDPSYDYLTVSFTFVADDPNSEMKGFVALCSPDGTTSTCFQFIIDDAKTCSSCNETNLVITATCNDNDPNDGIYEYSGSFDLFVGSGFEPCGNTSSSAGFETGTMSQNSGTFTIPFSINTNSPNEFQGNVTLCFYNDEFDITSCFKVTIQVVDPCVEGECYLENTHKVTCSKVENGVAYFDIDHALFIEEFFNEGYEPCNNILYPSVETGLGTFSNYYYVRGVEGWITALDLEIPCNRIGTSGNTAITYNFCNGNDHFCFILNLDLLCNSCPPLRPGFKGNAFSEMGIEVYPNPTMDNIHIVNKMPIDLCPQVKLYDLSGKLVLEKPLIIGNNTLDVLFLPQGMYFLKIENSENSDIIKYSIIR